MKVTDAVLQRSSIRAFLKSPVSNELLRDLLEKSSRAASGGNLQPWKIFVLNNKSLSDFLSFQEKWDQPEVPAYAIYPPKLKEPYRTSRYELGEQMYKLLGIGRDDKDARIAQVMKNFEFFGAINWYMKARAVSIYFSRIFINKIFKHFAKFKV